MTQRYHDMDALRDQINRTIRAAPPRPVQYIAEPRLVVHGEPKARRRTWRERLLSLTPWRAYRMEIPILPDPHLYQLHNPINGEETMVGHPETIRRLRGLAGVMAS
jgi:hypothetical protein